MCLCRLKQLLWDRLEESGWRYDVEEHAKGDLSYFDETFGMHVHSQLHFQHLKGRQVIACVELVCTICSRLGEQLPEFASAGFLAAEFMLK